VLAGGLRRRDLVGAVRLRLADVGHLFIGVGRFAIDVGALIPHFIRRVLARVGVI